MGPPSATPGQILRIAALAAVVAAAPWVRGATDFRGTGALALAAAAIVVAALAWWSWRDAPPPEKLAARVAERLHWLTPWRAALVTLLAGWLVAGVLLQGFPISDDIYASMMQAETFASGRLWAPAPPVPDAFGHPRFRVVGDIWISQYEPGWAVLLTPFTLLGLPVWLLPPFFAAGAVLLFWRLCRRRLDKTYSIIATLSLCTSAFFIFNANTLYSNSATMFLGLAAAESLFKRQEGAKLFWSLVAGLLIGLMGLIRPFNAIIFIAVIGPLFLIDLYRSKQWRALLPPVMFGIGGLPFIAGLLLYHDWVTGSPFTTIPSWIGWEEPIGAVNERSLELTIHRMSSLALTTSPLLAAASPFFVIVLWRRTALSFTDFVFPATVLAFLFYGGHGGVLQSYGPRYYFEAYPFLVLSAGACLAQLGSASSAARAAVATHFVMQLGGLASWMVFEAAAVRSIAEPYRLVRQAKLENALVILQTPPGRFRAAALPDMTRNGLDVTKPSVVYALDLGDGGAQLRAVFPDRSFWVYRDGTLEPLDGAPPEIAGGSGGAVETGAP